jgi:tetratricopeptide (TPR) repeat protein
MQALSSEFPRGDSVILLAALAHYNLQNFDEAQELFEELLGRDPHRIEVWCVVWCGVVWWWLGGRPQDDVWGWLGRGWQGSHTLQTWRGSVARSWELAWVGSCICGQIVFAPPGWLAAKHASTPLSLPHSHSHLYTPRPPCH